VAGNADRRRLVRIAGSRQLYLRLRCAKAANAMPRTNSTPSGRLGPQMELHPELCPDGRG